MRGETMTMTEGMPGGPADQEQERPLTAAERIVRDTATVELNAHTQNSSPHQWGEEISFLTTLENGQMADVFVRYETPKGYVSPHTNLQITLPDNPSHAESYMFDPTDPVDLQTAATLPEGSEPLEGEALTEKMADRFDEVLKGTSADTVFAVNHGH